MARKSTKENKNIYQRTREALDLTREEASDLLVTSTSSGWGMDRSLSIFSIRSGDMVTSRSDASSRVRSSASRVR